MNVALIVSDEIGLPAECAAAVFLHETLRKHPDYDIKTANFPQEIYNMVDGLDKIRVDLDPSRREEMMKLSGRRTGPQIFIGDYHVGGCDDLFALERAGKLDPLLRGEAA